eukprot:scaffold31252_cov63-Phaeocystis_antarctica.AAC.11
MSVILISMQKYPVLLQYSSGGIICPRPVRHLAPAPSVANSLAMRFCITVAVAALDRSRL